MINSVRSNNPKFKTITFKEGFNVILAERTKSSSDKDSRNGLGKTTLIEIIHFCLGSKSLPEDSLRRSELKGWTFILDITLNKKQLSVSRSTTNFLYVVLEGDFSDWPIKPDYDSTSKIYSMRIKEWTEILGYFMFAIPFDKKEPIYNPSFRSLISYYVRRNLSSFIDPFKYFPNQKEWDIQISNAFLLNLNWKYAQEFQKLKDKEITLRNLKKASKQGLLENFSKTIGELEAEKVIREVELARAKKELASFKVHPRYYDLQEKANMLTTRIHTITNAYILNERVLNKYQAMIQEERDVSIDYVRSIYEEVGLVFSEKIKKRLIDVEDFHKKIISNRKQYLNLEIEGLRKTIVSQKGEIEVISNERASLLEVLKTHGALDEHSRLESNANKIEKQINDIQSNISNLKKIESYKSQLTIDREILLQKTRQDWDERSPNIQAIQLFNKNSQDLYSEPGTLSINIDDTGYKFHIEITRATSQGIGYMKVFCYDLTLIQLHQEQDRPGFLIHDSTIFDGVDERQIAKALQLAATQASNNKFQYICTLNSDVVPYQEFSKEFIQLFNQSVRATFSDGSEDGGLLGLRF